jgi:hypothetical protein
LRLGLRRRRWWRKRRREGRKKGWRSRPSSHQQEK